MDEKLRSHVEALFENAPPTMKTVEIKEEILQNTMDRYHDLLAEGKDEQAAFNIAIAGIGDVEELLRSLHSEQGGRQTDEQWEREYRNSALLLAIAVMLYILCVLPVILLGNVWGICLMFVMVAFATGILIYRGKMRNIYHRADDTMVENFKEWNAQKQEQSSLRKSIQAAIGSVALAVYLLVSFSTGAWHITWIIFLISGALQNIAKACFDLKKGDRQ